MAKAVWDRRAEVTRSLLLLFMVKLFCRRPDTRGRIMATRQQQQHQTTKGNV